MHTCGRCFSNYFKVSHYFPLYYRLNWTLDIYHKANLSSFFLHDDFFTDINIAMSKHANVHTLLRGDDSRNGIEAVTAPLSQAPDARAT